MEKGSDRIPGSREWRLHRQADVAESKNILWNAFMPNRLCGLVVRVPGYRSRGPGSIPDATRFSEK
jgi:hypothetical protein